MSSAEERLQYYAARFPLVEVDSTYYFLPSERNAELWVARTTPGFVFQVKAFSLLTLHPTKAEAIPKGLARPEGKSRLYARDLGPEVVDEIWSRFLSAVEPLHREGRLGALLFQFPPWFGISRANKQYILECSRRCGRLPICVEFRNGSWLTEDNRSETLEFLEGYGLPMVCVDMPQGFRSSVPPVVAATAELAVVRFHGRNAAEWESGSVQRRFRYLYSDAELEEWVPRVGALAEVAGRTHVLMNNCYSDYAPRNATQMAAMLRQAGVAVAGPA